MLASHSPRLRLLLGPSIDLALQRVSYNALGVGRKGGRLQQNITIIHPGENEVREGFSQEINLAPPPPLLLLPRTTNTTR